MSLAAVSQADLRTNLLETIRSFDSTPPQEVVGKIRLLSEAQTILLSPEAPGDWIDIHLNRFLLLKNDSQAALRRYCAHFLGQLASQKPSKTLQVLPTCRFFMDDRDPIVQRLAFQSARALYPRALFYMRVDEDAHEDRNEKMIRSNAMSVLREIRNRVERIIEGEADNVDDGVYVQACYFAAHIILAQTSSPVFIRPTIPCQARGVCCLEDLPRGSQFSRGNLLVIARNFCAKLLREFSTKALEGYTSVPMNDRRRIRLKALLSALGCIGRVRPSELKTIVEHFEQVAKGLDELKTGTWLLEAMGEELLGILTSSVVRPMHHKIVELLSMVYSEDLPAHAWIIRAQKEKTNIRDRDAFVPFGFEMDSLMDEWDGDRLLGTEKVLGTDAHLHSRKVEMPGHIPAMALILQRESPLDAARSCLTTLHSALPPTCPIDKEGCRVVAQQTSDGDRRFANTASLPQKRLLPAEDFIQNPSSTTTIDFLPDNFPADPRQQQQQRKETSTIAPLIIPDENEQSQLLPRVFEELSLARKRRRREDPAFTTLSFEVCARMACVPSQPAVLRKIYDHAISQALAQPDWQQPSIKLFYNRLLKDQENESRWLEISFSYTDLMELFLEKFSQKFELSKEFRQFLNELPKMPPIIFNRLEQQCVAKDAEGATAGQNRKIALMTILSLIESFPNLRAVGLRLLLRLVYYNGGPDAAAVRNDAMRFMIGKVYKAPTDERPWQRPFLEHRNFEVDHPWPVPLTLLQGRYIEDAAAIMLRSIAPPYADFSYSVGASKDIEEVCTEVTTRANPIVKEDRLWLYLALCIKRPVHIHGLVEVFSVCEDSLKNHLVNSIEEAIKHMSSSDGEILSLVENAIPATEPIILKVLSILSSSSADMNPAFGPAVVNLYKRTKNPKLLVPVCGVLDRDSVLDYLPDIIQLEQEDVSAALKLLVTSKHATIGASELLTEIHHFNKPNDDLVPLKFSITALNKMLEMMDLFDSKVYGIVLQSIVEDTSPLPTLFMRTVIQLVKELPLSMADLVAQEILPRLIRREGFLADQRMWRGMMMVLTMTQPKCPGPTSAVLAMLPQTQLEDVLVQHPEWKGPLRDYVQKQPRDGVPAHVRSILMMH